MVRTRVLGGFGVQGSNGPKPSDAALEHKKPKKAKKRVLKKKSNAKARQTIGRKRTQKRVLRKNVKRQAASDNWQ